MNPIDLATVAKDIGILGATLFILLLRIEPKLDQVTQALNRLTVAVAAHSAHPVDPGDNPGAYKVRP